MSADGDPRPSTDAAVTFGRREILTLFALGAAVFLLIVVAAGNGVRGTDQYWYLADAESLAERGSAATTTIFPVGILGPGGTLAPPFVHNALGVYLAGVAATLLGGYWGWIAVNVAATFATSVLIFLAARTVARRWAAFVCAALYPLLPVVFWHMTQPLVEISAAFFAALAIWLLAIAGDRTIRWLGVVGAVGLLYLARESYLPLLLAVPIGFLLVRLSERRTGLATTVPPTALLSVAAIGIVWLGRVLLPGDNVSFSFARLVRTAVPGLTDNMWFNFDLSAANLADRLPFSWDLLPDKFVGHMAQQFVLFDSPGEAAFYWTFNVLALVAVVMLWRRWGDPRQRRLIVAALAFVAVQFATITLFQNQIRYTVPALPGLIVVLAIAISGVPWLVRTVGRRPLAAIALMTVIALVPNLAIGLVQRREATAFSVVEQEARRVWDAHVDATEPVVIVYSDRPQVLAYAADRRPTLFVSEAYSAAEYDRLRAAFPGRWLLAPAGSPAIEGLGAGAVPAVESIDVFGVEWGLHQLPD